MRLEVDYQLGEDFKEKIIPRAVDYFTGKALRYEDDFEDEDMEEFDEDDEDDDDEDDEVGSVFTTCSLIDTCVLSGRTKLTRIVKVAEGTEANPNQDCKQQ